MTDDATQRQPFAQGDEFLQYRIHSLLGRGGHAFVYSGQHLYMQRPVAIKVIPAPAEMNSDIYRRAQLEAKILSQLEHPNVVKVYDAGVTDAGVIYIVMEMLEGWTLRAALRSIGALTVPETLHIGVQIASAVQMAHAQHAIHRDLKPENVFVLPGNVVKVLDFGITKLLGTNTTLTTQPHVIRGTPQYMSPEHMEGHAVTVQSDIYALGSVLYELLAAIAPALVGLHEVSSYAIGYSQIHRMPPRLDELSPEIPRYVARSIQRMLAKTPGERPSSMQQVTDELRHLQVRYVAEFPAMAGVLRELWHAPLLEPQSQAARPSSATAVLGTVVLSDPLSRESAAGSPVSPLLKTRVIDQDSPTPTAISSSSADAGARAVPVPRKPSKKAGEPLSQSPFVAARRAPDAMALRLADRRSSSPAPVTLQRSGSSRTRTPSHTASLVLVAVVLGSIIGYGALMSIRRVSDRTSNASRGAATGEVVASAAQAAPVIAPAPQGLVVSPSAAASTPATLSSNALGAALANSTGIPVQLVNHSKTAAALAASTFITIGAAESDSGTARVSKDASQERALPRPNGSSTARSGKTPAAKERLIFGAEDLSW